MSEDECVCQANPEVCVIIPHSVYAHLPSLNTTVGTIDFIPKQACYIRITVNLCNVSFIFPLTLLTLNTQLAEDIANAYGITWR